MGRRFAGTAEHVSAGHPDKFCDQVADRILDQVLQLAADDGETLRSVRTAVECLAKDNLLVISGEAKMPAEVRANLNPGELARQVWKEIGYGSNPDELTVIDHIRNQSPDIASGKGEGRMDGAEAGGTGVDGGGAGDQGIMVGYATNETPEMMPREWLLARNLVLGLAEKLKSGELEWLQSDCKSQVTLGRDGEVTSVIIAAQHLDGVSDEEIARGIFEHVVLPVVGEIDRDRVTINGTGRFVIGGPTGDAGVVGRKIVVDAYGPRVPVGGGAYSGKDPSKVDRSAAYMARHIAKTVVAHGIGNAQECTVRLAYGIGRHQPEMVLAVTDRGEDVSSWVKETFGDLSPLAIIDRLGLRTPNGWSYTETAAYGHYGRDGFPWERIADV